MAVSYRWVIVGIGALMGCVAAGTMFSLAVFLEPMARQTEWSRAEISSAMTINFLVMGVGGFAWGAISDRFGPRIVALCGAVLLGAGLLVASRATTPLAFRLGYGILIGLSAAAFFAPMIAAVTSWFNRQRALAVSLVSAGIGVAPITVSPFAAWLIANYDWRSAMALIGIFAWVLLLPAALLVRSAPQTDDSGAPFEAAGGEADSPPVVRALGSAQFVVLALTFFLCCGAHSGPIFHMISYAQLCGVSALAAVSIYSVEGFAGLAGRLLFALAADRYGAKPILVAGLFLQALAIATYPLVGRIEQFYALALVFGTAYGGVMPLYAVLAREYFGQRIMGTVLGAATMMSSLGMAFGPLAGGWIFDAFHAYRWLYLGSAAVALAAAAVALAFPPARRVGTNAAAVAVS